MIRVFVQHIQTSGVFLDFFCDSPALCSFISSLYRRLNFPLYNDVNTFWQMCSSLSMIYRTSQTFYFFLTRTQKKNSSEVMHDNGKKPFLTSRNYNNDYDSNDI